MAYEFYLYSFQRIFGEAMNAIAKAKGEGIEIPSSLEKELQDAEELHLKAKGEYYTNRNEEAADAILKAATDGASKVFHEALRLHLSGLFQWACTIRDSYSDYEYLAFDCIPKYRDVHSKNLYEIRKLLENWTLRGKSLGNHQVYSLCGQLRDFLNDFEIGKPGLVAEIKEKKEEKREREEAKREATKRFYVSTRLNCVVIFLTLIGIVVGVIGLFVKGCSDSSQQTAQPEASASETELQSEANNPTPNP